VTSNNLIKRTVNFNAQSQYQPTKSRNDIPTLECTTLSIKEFV